MCSPAHHLSLDSVQNGTTALYLAAQTGHLRVVELLIAAKAQVDIQMKVKFIIARTTVSIVSLVSVQGGFTALLVACIQGHCEVVKHLVERAHCDTSE